MPRLGKQKNKKEAQHSSAYTAYEPVGAAYFEVVARGGRATIVSWPALIFLFCFFVVLVGGADVVFIALVGLTLYGVTGVAAGLRALMLVAVVRILNPTLVSFPEGSAVLTWGLVLLASGRILVTFSAADIRIVGPLWIYALVVAVLSMAGSPFPDISLMKLLSFTVSASAALVGFRRLDDEARAQFLVWLCSLWLVVVLLSIPTLLAPHVAFAVNNRGFQGVLNHPQGLASYLVPAMVWFTSQAFGTRRKIDLLAAFGAIGLSAMMLATLARTSVAACVLAFGFATLLGRLRRRADLSAARRRLLVALVSVACVAVLTIATSSNVSERVQGFVFKGNVEDYRDVGDAFYASRGRGMEAQWRSFLENPIIGTGFQVYRSPEFYKSVIRVWGIAVSAPVEKGFVFISVLEETGLIGGVFFVFLLYSIYCSVKATGDLRRIALFFSCIFVNVGEGVFFSAGGLGLYFWILIGFAAAGTAGEGRRRRA